MQFTASLASFVTLVLCAATSAFVVPGTPPARRTHHTALSRISHTTRVPSSGMNAPARDRVRKRSAQIMGVFRGGDDNVDAGNEAAILAAQSSSSSSRGPHRLNFDSIQSERRHETVQRAACEPQLSPTSAAPAKTEIPTEVPMVGNPQKVAEKEYSIEAILKELAEIQDQGPKNCCVLGTRHCSYLHQQIIELLAYALVLSGNHVFTSGALGTNAATIRGALRAERDDLLTVVLPQSLSKQSEASRELLEKVKNVITMPKNDNLPLDAASRLCNSDLLKRTDQLICFAFHDSHTIIETSKEARKRNMIVTDLYLD